MLDIEPSGIYLKTSFRQIYAQRRTGALTKDLVRFISQIVSCEGNSLVSQWNLTGDEDFFRDHFEGMPVLPGMMILESLVTAATWFARKESDFTLLDFRMSDLTNYKLPNS